jgi:hypothetical protein
VRCAQAPCLGRLSHRAVSAPCSGILASRRGLAFQRVFRLPVPSKNFAPPMQELESLRFELTKAQRELAEATYELGEIMQCWAAQNLPDASQRPRRTEGNGSAHWHAGAGTALSSGPESAPMDALQSLDRQIRDIRGRLQEIERVCYATATQTAENTRTLDAILSSRVWRTLTAAGGWFLRFSGKP